jgi:hypothetical protein
VLGIFLMRPTKKSETSQKIQESPATNVTPEETALKGSIFDLVKLNKTQTCTFSVSAEGSMMSGTIYMSGKNVRYVSEVTVPNASKVATNMIRDGEWVYSWSSASQQGLKMKLETMENMAKKSMENSTKPNEADLSMKLKADANHEYKCRTWNGDAKMFELPKDIQFMDFTETMKSVSDNAMPDKTQSSTMCSACGYATDPKDVAACKAQFNC